MHVVICKNCSLESQIVVLCVMGQSCLHALMQFVPIAMFMSLHGPA